MEAAVHRGRVMSADAVSSLVARLGASYTLRNVLITDPSPSNPGAGGTPTNTDYSISAILTRYNQHHIDDTVILSTDRKAIVDVVGLDAAAVNGLKPNSKVIDGSDIYSVVEAQVRRNAGAVTALVMQLRKQ